MAETTARHFARAVSLADQITTFAESAVAPLDRTIGAWPAEFRAIMWDAVAAVAKARADNARDPQ